MLALPYFGRILKKKPDNFTGVQVTDAYASKSIFIEAKPISFLESLEEKGEVELYDEISYDLKSLYTALCDTTTTGRLNVYLYKNNNQIAEFSAIVMPSNKHQFNMMLACCIHGLTKFDNVKFLVEDKDDVLYYHFFEPSNNLGFFDGIEGFYDDLSEKIVVKLMKDVNQIYDDSLVPGIHYKVNLTTAVSWHVGLTFYTPGKKRIMFFEPEKVWTNILFAYYGYPVLHKRQLYVIGNDSKVYKLFMNYRNGIEEPMKLSLITIDELLEE